MKSDDLNFMWKSLWYLNHWFRGGSVENPVCISYLPFAYAGVAKDLPVAGYQFGDGITEVFLGFNDVVIFPEFGVVIIDHFYKYIAVGERFIAPEPFEVCGLNVCNKQVGDAVELGVYFIAAASYF